ncbi:MAG: XdhC family protein [Fimbriimonadaceae bacterium]|nr:XdhC family protein [Fimbriimonadaceae bacterium]
MDDGIYDQLATRLAAGQRGALALVIATKGSTPQRAGAKAVFTPAGEILGTIGGGCLEHEARLRALDCLRDGQPARITVDLTHDWDQDTGLICGGLADILILVPAPGEAPLYAAVAAAREAGQTLVVTHGVAGEQLGQVALAVADGERRGDAALLEAAAAALTARQGGLLGEHYHDLLVPRPRLWIAGAGHVGQALARCAAAVGFAVTVIDDRADLCTAAQIPAAAEHWVGDIERLLGQPVFGPDDFVVVVTRGHRHDAAALRAVIRSAAGYVGLIGSRRKIKLIAEGLLDEGAADAAELAGVYAPIGLDIGAVTVDEIAVSIVAELIAVRRGRLRHPSQRDWRAKGQRPAGSCQG